MPSFEIRSERRQLEGWRFFWAKRVKAFRSDVHCARCLVGSYVKPFGVRAPTNTVIEIPDVAAGDIVYFCGVSDPYRWPRNMHLAVQIEASYSFAAEVEMYTADRLMIRGARQLAFDDKVALRDHGHRDKTYTTCRNFQFGAQAFAEGLLPADDTIRGIVADRFHEIA